MIGFQNIKEAAHLTQTWDEITTTYFQKRKFLSHAEKYNPCQQRYYLCFDNGVLMAAAIVYSLRIDILTFIQVKSPIKMNIVGIPCSVSSSGIFGDKAAIDLLKHYIYEQEKGFVLFLNLEDKPQGGSQTCGKTLPTIVLNHHFKNWDDYLSSLRANYRRRLKRINQPNDNLRFEKKQNSEFTEEMFKLYLEVYNRSAGKLEKLNHDFFRFLPQEFILTICYECDTVIGWNLALEDGQTYYFFLGGIDYKYNKKDQTYLRLLSRLIKSGIENGAEAIELGQTAEIPKMRMGGKPMTKYMEAHHSNRFLNSIIKRCSSLLEYNRVLEDTNAIKEENR